MVSLKRPFPLIAVPDMRPAQPAADFARRGRGMVSGVPGIAMS